MRVTIVRLSAAALRLLLRLSAAALTLLIGLLLVFNSDGYKKQRMIEEIERRGYCTQ